MSNGVEFFKQFQLSTQVAKSLVDANASHLFQGRYQTDKNLKWLHNTYQEFNGKILQVYNDGDQTFKKKVDALIGSLQAAQLPDLH